MILVRRRVRFVGAAVKVIELDFQRLARLFAVLPKLVKLAADIKLSGHLLLGVANAPSQQRANLGLGKALAFLHLAFVFKISYLDGI